VVSRPSCLLELMASKIAVEPLNWFAAGLGHLDWARIAGMLTDIG